MDNDNLLEEYYTQNARKLRRMVDRILRRFSGISQKDYDDFYSLANEVFTGALRRFDGTQSFEGFLYACLFNRIKTEFTKRNREKRKTDTQSVSLDTPVGDGESVLGDMLESDFDMEAELEKKGTGLTEYMDRAVPGRAVRRPEENRTHEAGRADKDRHYGTASYQ